MPSNYYLGSRTGINPFGSQLEGMVKHTVANQLKRGREYYMDSVPAGKRQKVDGLFSETSGKTRMPKKYRTKRRRGTRRRTGRKRMRIIPSLWPREKLVRMKLCSKFTFGPTGSTVCSIAPIKANSFNDPMGAYGAQLPLGLDQYAALYAKYIVIGSRITLKFHNVSSTGAVAVGIGLFDNATSLNQAEYYMETPGTKSVLLSPDVDHTVLKKGYSAKKFWRIKNLHDNVDQHGALSTTPGDPTDIAYWHFWFQDVNATENMTIEGFAQIDYYVLLMDRIMPARSAL